MIIKIMTMLALLVGMVVPSWAAVLPLEITNIKASGTGTPAIPSTNRIFRAYPGIEYNIRAGVIGGAYPYTYELSGQPSGMVINSRTGEISWPNPTTTSGTITLTVTDSLAAEDTATWVVTVTSSTSDFIFVNGAYSGTETGSITQPYSSLANMLAAQTDNYKIVYFRAGTYAMVDYNSTNDYVMNLETSPRTWIEYPGETVVLQGGSANSSQAHRITSFSPFYFDGLIFNDMVDYGVMSYSTSSYTTIRNCMFDGLRPSDGTNNNYGWLHTTNEGSAGYFMVLQDNDFTDWCNTAAIGSLYNDAKTLIENNNFHDQGDCSASPAGIGGTVAIGPKMYGTAVTVRGNRVAMSSGTPIGGLNSAFIYYNNNEINHNLFLQTGATRVGHNFYYECSFHPGDITYHHNTLIGDIGMWCEDPEADVTTRNNVISNPNTAGFFTYIQNYISYNHTAGYNAFVRTDNLTDTTASNLVDSADDYKLVPAQSAYIGTRGWQLSDGLVPMELGDASDTTAPTVSSASVNGTTATINFDETVVTTSYDAADFNYDCTTAGTNISLTSPTGSGSSRTFTVATSIGYGDTCNLDYVGSTDDIEDAAGNDMVTFSDTSVTNNTPATSTAPMVGATAVGATIVH